MSYSCTPQGFEIHSTYSTATLVKLPSPGDRASGKVLGNAEPVRIPEHSHRPWPEIL